jgi:hypothetical protein
MRITEVRRVVGKCTWAFTALIAPELVLTIALHQYLVAVEYRSIVNKYENGGKGGESWWKSICCFRSDLRVGYAGGFVDKGGTGVGGVHIAAGRAATVPRRNISLNTAFYAVMGGFSLKTTPTTALTTTLDMLVKRGTMEKIRQYPTAVDGKSEADLLAKAAACFQAGWMLLQCLGRKLQELPVTLLELNTVVHVLSAIIMYLLWLEKPVDVRVPSPIDQVWAGGEMEGSFVGVHALEESLETVI